MNLNELATMGIHISLVGDDRIRASVPTHIDTPELKEEIVANKPQLIEELKARLAKGDELLDIWRRDTTPHWRDILQESIEKGDYARRDYAVWMLREILHADD